MRPRHRLPAAVCVLCVFVGARGRGTGWHAAACRHLPLPLRAWLMSRRCCPLWASPLGCRALTTRPELSSLPHLAPRCARQPGWEPGRRPRALLLRGLTAVSSHPHPAPCGPAGPATKARRPAARRRCRVFLSAPLAPRSPLLLHSCFSCSACQLQTFSLLSPCERSPASDHRQQQQAAPPRRQPRRPWYRRRRRQEPESASTRPGPLGKPGSAEV